MTNPNDLILRKDALQVLSDEIDLARVAFPQVIPILAADMREIAAIPAVTNPQIADLQVANARLVDLVSEVLRDLDAFTGWGQPTGDAEDWATRARAILVELGEPK